MAAHRIAVGAILEFGMNHTYQQTVLLNQKIFTHTLMVGVSLQVMHPTGR